MSQDVLGRSALDIVSGPLADLMQKLGGKNGEQWLSDLNRFLRKEENGAQVTFPVWKTIRVVRFRDTVDIYNALSAAHCKTDWVSGHMLSDLKDKFPLGMTGDEYDFVNLSGDELGLGGAKTASLRQVCQRGSFLGLQACPPEAVIELRIQYQDQPREECLLVVMEPIAANPALHPACIFGLTHRSMTGLFLIGNDASSNQFFPSNARWIFVQPHRAFPLMPALSNKYAPEAAAGRHKALQDLKHHYLRTFAEDTLEGTNFDCAVLDALDSLEKQFCTP